VFRLVGAKSGRSNGRRVFEFRLDLDPDAAPDQQRVVELEQTRVIPSPVKQQVWKRDKGACVICGNKDNLHFDHVIPYSRGGSSLVAENIQLLCARHNLSKRDRIE
jgi:5-methylcytosine-specific restriction endonuclease McrA